MRASCSICTENFTNESEISAVPCGHTFHDECLKKWFVQSKTCPQCRKSVVVKSVIHKLFFTEGDGDDNPTDVGKLKNELNTLRLNLRQKDSEKTELENEQDRLRIRISGLQENVESMKLLYQQERSKTDTLKKELSYMKKMQTEAELAKEEAVKLRTKLKDLKNIQDVVNGMVVDIEEKVKNSNTQDLAKWCVIQEKELRRKRLDCKKLQEDLHVEIRSNVKLKQALAERTKNCSTLEEKLNISEKDVISLEKQNGSLKKKLEALQQALDSPSESSVEKRFARRLINESPAPAPTLKKPRLSNPNSTHTEIDLDSSFDDMLNLPPYRKKPLAKSDNMDRLKKHASVESKETKYVKLTTAASRTSSSKSRPGSSPVKDISNLPPSLYNLNILKKTCGSMLLKQGDSSSFVKKGYNGLGGHDKHIEPRGHPLAASLKTTKKVTSASSSGQAMDRQKLSSLFKVPPLPSLE